MRGLPPLSRRGVLLGAVATCALAGCGGEPATEAEQERPLSAEEAEQLALTRFRLHQEPNVPVTLEWPSGEQPVIDANLELTSGFAYGAARAGEGAAAFDRLIGWSTAMVATAAPTDDPQGPPLGEWSTRALSTSIPHDLFLSLALTLGTDRPENPVLIRQGSARFLRRDEVAGAPVSVFSGPRPATEGADSDRARTRYWLDDDGVLQRFEAYLGDARGLLARITRSSGAPDDQVRDRVTQVLQRSG